MPGENTNKKPKEEKRKSLFQRMAEAESLTQETEANLSSGSMWISDFVRTATYAAVGFLGWFGYKKVVDDSSPKSKILR